MIGEMPRPARKARDSLSATEARRVALAAQGLADPVSARGIGRREVLTAIRRLGLLQMDSVNVLVRSHYLPLFSRLGGYPTDLLDDAVHQRPRVLFEYWGHEASLLPVETHPLLRWRMQRAAELRDIYGGIAGFARERRPFIEEVYAQVAARGPLSAAALAEPGPRGGPWWGWTDGKRALEWLFWAGRLTTAGRRNFERTYDLPERVLPRATLAAPTPTAEEAQRGLLLIAARAHGVGTEADLRDYFRMSPGDARPRLAELVEAGLLRPVAVEGWRQPAFLDPAARLPRRAAGRALLSPFDSLVWERARTERVFGFHYRLEIYTPAPRRRFGYYVLPFLLGERLVARVDLKAVRAERRLEVRGAHLEAGEPAGAVAEALAGELCSLATWLGLGDVAVGPRGDLAPALRDQLAPRR